MKNWEVIKRRKEPSLQARAGEGQGGCSIKGALPNSFSTEFGPSDTWLPIRLYQGKFRLGIRKNSFVERVFRHWNRLSQEVVELLWLKVFKNPKEVAPGDKV